jgi:hypothetical protein
MSHTVIHSINFSDHQITVLFNQIWFQEDIATLYQLLLKKIPNHYVKETIIGADRESVRFQWRETEFVINFDCYSQSCWFETQDPHNAKKAYSLFNLLTQNDENYAG